MRCRVECTWSIIAIAVQILTKNSHIRNPKTLRGFVFVRSLFLPLLQQFFRNGRYTQLLPAVAFGEKNQFQLMLAPGETRTCTVLYYVRAEIELSDLYLRANLGGNAMTEVKTADNVMNEEWLALA